MKLFVFLSLGIFWCLAPLPVSAQVHISEVFPAPSIGNEWVELYNSSNTSQALSGWKLLDQLSSPSEIYVFSTELLPAYSYIVIELPSAKLNNSSDGVSLQDSQHTVIDQMSYTSSQTEMSWSKTADNTWVLSTPSKGEPNPSPTPAPSPSPSPQLSPSPTTIPNWWNSIRIAEVFPCPTDNEQEKIHLHNSDSVAHLLENWKIIDNSNQSRTVTLSIESQQNGIVTWSSSFLNNSGDSITLSTDTGYIVDLYSYTHCGPTTSPTPSPSALPSPSQTPPQPSPTTSTSQPQLHNSMSPTANIAYLYTPLDILLGSPSAYTNSTSSISHLEFPQHQTSLTSLLSVILGGFLLCAAGGYLLYETDP